MIDDLIDSSAEAHLALTRFRELLLVMSITQFKKKLQDDRGVFVAEAGMGIICEDIKDIKIILNDIKKMSTDLRRHED